MILDPNTRMAEAVRLTRAGRLAEATALLQGVPQSSPEASEGFDRESMRTAFRGGQLIDAVSPRSGSTHWTASAQRHSATPAEATITRKRRFARLTAGGSRIRTIGSASMASSVGAPYHSMSDEE
jgi:hypothetical protein